VTLRNTYDRTIPRNRLLNEADRKYKAIKLVKIHAYVPSSLTTSDLSSGVIGMADSPEARTLSDAPDQFEQNGITASRRRRSERIDQIDIARAEEEFYTLSRQLIARAEAAEKTSQLSAATRSGKDSEKGGNASGGGFDLREYLTSSNDANQNAGIKHKVRKNSFMFGSCIV
jgi:hypothetical protein